MHKTYGRLCPTALLIFVLIGSISLAAAADESNDKSIVGFWFRAGRQKATNIEMLEICHFKPDGTFSITFRKMKDGKLVEEQNESGRWERNQNVKTLVTTHMNGKQLETSRYITEKYLITELTDSEMRYEHIKSHAKFKAIRVREDFKFP